MDTGSLAMVLGDRQSEPSLELLGGLSLLIVISKHEKSPED